MDVSDFREKRYLLATVRIWFYGHNFRPEIAKNLRSPSNVSSDVENQISLFDKGSVKSPHSLAVLKPFPIKEELISRPNRSVDPAAHKEPPRRGFHLVRTEAQVLRPLREI